MITFALLQSVMAFALPDYCTPLPAVQKHVGYCEDNPEYVKASDACLQKIDEEVLQYQQALAKDFASRAAASAAAQDSKFVNHDGNLGDTSASIRALLADALRAREELVAYVKSIMYPGNPTSEMMVRYNLAGFLAQFPCFHDQREALLNRIGSLDRKIADLRRTESTNLALLGRSTKDLGNLQGNARVPAAVSRTVAAGAAQARGGKPGASTITGQIRDPKLPPH